MEKSEKQAITNGKVRETGNIGYNTQIEDEKNPHKTKRMSNADRTTKSEVIPVTREG